MTAKFLDSFSEEIWRSTYKDYEDTDLESTFRRVAKTIASSEKTDELKKEWEEKFYDLLSDFKCLPGGRILSNAGTKWKNTFINCFVSPRSKTGLDSIEGIMLNLKNQVLTLKSEGGWGENFSYIRPRGSFIHGIGVESPGSVKYMELFNKSSDVITSGSGKKSTRKDIKGKIRKGAQMAILDVWHPDIVEFIESKQKSGKLDKFNISVNCTNVFMEKLLKIQELIKAKAPQEDIDKENKWDLIFPDTTFHAYNNEWDGFIDQWIMKKYPIIVFDTVKVTDLWELIMMSTYNRNDPGVVFLDRAQEFYPANYQGRIVATNPCSEQMLESAGLCDLGSLNLTQFLNEDMTDFDYEKIKKYAKILTRFLDNVNDISLVPLQDYEKSMKNLRRIGCGVMGWGSSLYMLQVKFGSKQAENFRVKILENFSKAVYEESIDLAIEKGMFPKCNPEKHSQGIFIKNLSLSEKYMEKIRIFGIRNSSCLSIQPTGNTSIFANIVSGGLEPVFLPEYIRTVIVSTTPDHIKNLTPKWEEGEFFETEMFKFSKEGDDVLLRGVDKFGVVFKIDKNRGMTKEVLCMDYGVRNLKERNLWDEKADYAATSMSLSVREHLDDFTDFCKYTDSACSKTINVSNNYPYEDFKELYCNAFKTGFIKGLTTYRAGTMSNVLAASTSTQEIKQENFNQNHAPKRPKFLDCELHSLSIKGEKWLIVVGLLYGKPYEILGGLSNKIEIPTKIKNGILAKNGTKLKSSYDLILKVSDEDFLIKDIVSVFDNVEYATHTRLISLALRHGTPIKYIVEQLQKDNNCNIFDFSKVIARCLKKYIEDEKCSLMCENCMEKALSYKEGCVVCNNCGVSKCS